VIIDIHSFDSGDDSFLAGLLDEDREDEDEHEDEDRGDETTKRRFDEL
jgi:hypothetical protein